MNTTTSASGSCLCGGVSLSTQTMPSLLGACHCSTCRKWGGGPLLAVNCKQDLSITGNAKVTVFSSSEWAERGFCSDCGTHLFCRLKQANHYLVPVGVFDTNTSIEFDHQIFIDSKPSYYSFENTTQNLTGAQVFAQFATSASDKPET